MPDWGMLLGDLTAVQLVLWIAAAIGAIYLLVKSWPLLRNAVKIGEALLQLPGIADQLPELAKQVKQIHHETHNNNGTSIKDSVDRIEVSVEGMHGRMDTVEKDIGGVRQDMRNLRDVDLEQGKKIDGLDDKLDRHLEWSAETIKKLEDKS